MKVNLILENKNKIDFQDSEDLDELGVIVSILEAKNEDFDLEFVKESVSA